MLLRHMPPTVGLRGLTLYGTLDRIRTDTVKFLKLMTLPVGLLGHNIGVAVVGFEPTLFGS